MMIQTIKNIRTKGIIKVFLFIALVSLFSCDDDEEALQEVIKTIPIAAFTESADANDWKTYNFTDRSTNSTGYVWDFGDGNTSTEAEPSHSYLEAGDYVVILTVSNVSDVTDTVEKTIKVRNPSAPLSAFTAIADANDWKTYTFTNQSQNATSYSWDFGDGTSSTDAEPTHTFTGEGTFTVKLTATSASGDDVSEQILELIDPNAAVMPTFKAIVQNGTADDFQVETNDNADAWDMTPNSTVKLDADGGATSPSPYRDIWYNSDLDSWLEASFGDDSEQPGSSGDGNKFAGLGDRGVKLNEASRRLYQVLTVEAGVEYTFTIDSRSESAGVNSEVFILNNEIVSEDAINTEANRNINADAYFVIDNDFNSSKSSSTEDTFTTNTFTFKPTTDKIVIYVRALNAVDSSNEVFFDNIDIITPGFESGSGSTTTTATFKAIVQNGTADDFQVETNDNADAWDMTPNSTVKLDSDGGATSPSPYQAIWSNSDLDSWLDTNFGDDSEQPGSSGDGNKFAGLGDRGVKLNEASRRLYQVLTVEVGVEYTFTIDSRSESEGVNSEVFILNNEIVSEDAINTEANRDINADAYFVIDNDFNSTKSSSTEDTFTTNTFTFIPTTDKIVIYVRALNAVDSSNEVFFDNIDIITPGF
ncbi:PKD domain-containing protein [Lutibacter sp. TH_r2]|uniref:PKD domain-containing protein n=1 Tax=Lutibacter sp. TH_r2 TaxID=3082083 RepID=UPI0029538C7F|nr:PKD domain-containing protein [Lutibacter sp. TH_r2]MDV7186443.1 PKD domain-containing protein [Lutibacter sp. TH_r2]